MDGTLRLVTAPTVEPLTVAEAKDWARITQNVEDDLLDGMLFAARAHVEELTGRALITQTWDYFLDAFPRQIDLPRPRLLTLTSIKYIDADGVQQTLAASEYTADDKREPARIVPAYGKSWPATRSVPNAVVARYDAGYGPAAVDVPQQLRQAIGVLIATMYKYREQIAEAQVYPVPSAFWQIINQHRIWWL